MNAASLALLVALGAAAAGQKAECTESLRFSIAEGGTLDEFHRDELAAAHLVATPGRHPRLVIAFPAGNSGVAIWFDASGAGVAWRPGVTIESASMQRGDGAVLRGISAEIAAEGGTLSVRQALLGSVRVIRDYEHSGTVPAGIAVAPRVESDGMLWERRRLDGAGGYLLRVDVLEGSVSAGLPGRIAFTPTQGGRLRLRVTAMTGDPPLAPLTAGELLTAAAAPDAQLRRSLEFLAYREKFLAGSWRFNTYFGRDTLMALRLLSAVATPLAMETGLASVLRRLDDDGEVAHEEDIGEFAVLRRREAGLPGGDAPLFDYHMVDDDFMLAPVMGHYLLDRVDGRNRGAAFLAELSGPGRSNGDALVTNLRFVVAAARDFAREPQWRNLVSLQPGRAAGNWRDSESGLGGGRFPFDVNAVWIPAALLATDRLYRSGLLDPYLAAQDREDFGRAASLAAIWSREAPPLFDVVVAAAEARSAVRGYAGRLGIDAAEPVASLAGKGVRFRAVALDASGRPVPVQNSDEAFALLFLDPPPDEVERIAGDLVRPFPAGLATAAGLLVSNPAFAPARLERAFDRNHYHGTVIWSWHQALFDAGIRRQLGRNDLTPAARAALERAASFLRRAIAAGNSRRGAELWSWEPDDREVRPVSFGQQSGHETESNAVQLWSTVHLAAPVR